MVAELETGIWRRLTEPSWDSLSPQAAEGILRLQFDRSDIDRMHQLSALAQESSLTQAQQEELETYMRIGRMVSILQAKARLAMKNQQSRSG